jgi:vacuolar-type H+-ATPase catalytic subunit A/Vma1
MKKISSLNEFKQKKIHERVIEDIDKILHVISLAQQSLSFFKQYIPVQKLVSMMETQKTLLEIHRKKNETELEKIKKSDTKPSES